MLIHIILLFLASDIAFSSHLPSYIKPCSRRDPQFDECSLKAAKAALPSIIKGDKKYGIPKLNPLKLERVELQNGDRLSFKFKDVEVHGVKNMNLKKFTIDVDGQKVHVEADIPNLVILGDYELNGRILVLPLNGNGDANITCTGVKFTYSYSYKLITKEGNQFSAIDKDSLEFKIGRAFFQFNNLFNGNEELGKSTNEVINKEWEQVVEEIKPAVKETISAIAKAIISGVISKLAFDELILDV